MDDYSGFLCIFSLIVIGGLIAIAFLLIKRSTDEVSKSEALYNEILRNVPSDKQALFVMQYNSQKKSITTAVLLALFLGGVGAHKFYMNETGIGIMYLLFCWTGIPAIIAVIDAFTIARKVAKKNQQKATEISMIIK